MMVSFLYNQKFIDTEHLKRSDCFITVISFKIIVVLSFVTGSIFRKQLHEREWVFIIHSTRPHSPIKFAFFRPLNQDYYLMIPIDTVIVGSGIFV